ncbi:DEAD/DEAH box RNA helicase [Hortaea werneckii]|nr:DEAD/DEAH box RNA helicase [Hortaea werneckii]
MSDGWGSTAPTEGGQQTANSEPWGITEQGTDGNDWGTAPDSEADKAKADADTAVNPSLRFEALTLGKDEFRERACAAGWIDTTAFNYTEFQCRNNADRKSFEDAGIHPVVLENIKLARYVEPTPIQSYCIPPILESKDVVAVAQTGSGKTSAYMIPVLSRLMGKAKKLAAPKPNTVNANYNPRLHKVKAEPLVVIVVPTRELTIQIFDEARRMCYRSMLRPCVVYGGLPKAISLEELSKGCDLLIATPGRLCDLMDQPQVLTMSRVKYTIIDEAYKILHSDWEAELHKIMAGGGSSSLHPRLLQWLTQGPATARRYMAEDYTRVRLGRSGAAHKNIRQHILYVDQDQKRECLYDLLVNMKPARTMVFCNLKSQVDLIDDFLYNRGLPSTSIHSDRSQLEREDAIRAFRTGKEVRILVATGVSARGLDVVGMEYVIKFDLPSSKYGGEGDGSGQQSGGADAGGDAANGAWGSAVQGGGTEVSSSRVLWAPAAQDAEH